MAVLICASPFLGQVDATQFPPSAQVPQVGEERGGRGKDPEEVKRERDMEKARNKERQQSLQKDTTQLLQLATELKQYVDKSNENTLSLDVIKKAEEIEKLAHRVKDKMRSN
jgi:hypothetical protein